VCSWNPACLRTKKKGGIGERQKLQLLSMSVGMLLLELGAMETICYWRLNSLKKRGEREEGRRKMTGVPHIAVDMEMCQRPWMGKKGKKSGTKARRAKTGQSTYLCLHRAHAAKSSWAKGLPQLHPSRSS